MTEKNLLKLSNTFSSQCLLKYCVFYTAILALPLRPRDLRRWQASGTYSYLEEAKEGS